MSDKKSSLFGKLETREDALKMAKDCGTGFFVVAGIQAALSFLVGYGILFDAAIYAVCGYFIRNRQSRAAAVIVLIVGIAALGVTVMNKIGQTQRGGNNIFLAVIVVWAGIRSAEATFKLRGRFAAVPAVPLP